jgi:hypothetical protein
MNPSFFDDLARAIFWRQIASLFYDQERSDGHQPFIDILEAMHRSLLPFAHQPESVIHSENRFSTLAVEYDLDQDGIEASALEGPSSTYEEALGQVRRGATILETDRLSLVLAQLTESRHITDVVEKLCRDFFAAKIGICELAAGMYCYPLIQYLVN